MKYPIRESFKNSTQEQYHFSSNIDELSQLCFENSHACGWWTDLASGLPLARNRPEIMMLMVSEIAEMMEGFRKSKQDEHLPEFTSEEVELADLLIRAFDYAAGFGLRLGDAFAAKLLYNMTREDHKISNRQAEGGKKF